MGRRSRRRKEDRDQIAKLEAKLARHETILAGARAAVERQREEVAQAEALREHMGPEEAKALEAAQAGLRENERLLAEHEGEPPPAG